MNNVRKTLAAMVATVAVVMLAGCEEETIVYEGVERPESEVAEIISDKLEVENPNLDIEVTVNQSYDE